MLEKKKDPFPKYMADACQILSGWQNVYGNSSKFTEANDGIAFATTGTIDDASAKNKKNNILHVSSARKMATTQMNVLRQTNQDTRIDQVS